MKTGKNDFEKLLSEAMCAETLEMDVPAASDKMRMMVLSRKKVQKENTSFIFGLIEFFRHEFRFYHLGVSALLITAGAFYMNTSTYDATDASDFINTREGLSISNNTISVNSSTMLTSIPTMVIRN